MTYFLGIIFQLLVFVVEEILCSNTGKKFNKIVCELIIDIVSCKSKRIFQFFIFFYIILSLSSASFIYWPVVFSALI